MSGTFRLTCDAVNIGALRTPLPDIKVACYLSARSADGTAIPAAELNPTFYAEAGSVTATAGQQAYTYSPTGGASSPKDVAPDDSRAEPSYTDDNNTLRNPRDGLVTIIAVVEGQEAFIDTNSNGQWDPGEPFEDLAEPFLDEDDDDVHGLTEPYVDDNGNMAWNQGNGQWDAKVKIMAIYKILWTGALDNAPNTSRIDRVSSTIANGGKLELNAYALDANMNPVAAFQHSSDSLEWTLSSGGDATSSDPAVPPMDNVRGFSFDEAASTERERWQIVPSSFAALPFKLTVEDGSPGDASPPTPFTVTATVHASPGPSGGGSFLPQLAEEIADTVQGTCD